MYPSITRPVMQFNNNKNGVVTCTIPTVSPTLMQNIDQCILDFAHYNEEEVGDLITPLPPCNNVVLSSNCAFGSVPSKLHSAHLATEGLKSIKSPGNSMGKYISSQSKGAKRPEMGENMDPDEEERRRLKRERNKLAAANCRKRRVNLSNTLEEETENLESNQSKLKDQIAKLLEEKEQLEFVLGTHNPFCTKGKNKDISENVPEKPKRPCSLPLNPAKQESLSTPNSDASPDWISIFSAGFNSGNIPVISPSSVTSILTPLGDSNSNKPLQWQLDEY